jgi:hypothetical protein
MGILLLSGCVRTGEIQFASEAVALDGAETARVELRMGVGEVRVAGGASGLLDAGFIYNVEGWKPEVKYNVQDGEGRLVVQHPSSAGDLNIRDADNLRNEWDLKLNDQVPMDMDIELGVGESTLSFAALNLHTLDLQVGVGRSTLDLTGSWQHDVEANITGGIGEANIDLPADVGVRVHIEEGIGSVDTVGLHKVGNDYVNDAYGISPTTLDIDIAGGIGDINLHVGK